MYHISRFFLISYYFESNRDRGRAYSPEFVRSDEINVWKEENYIRIYLKKDSIDWFVKKYFFFR